MCASNRNRVSGLSGPLHEFMLRLDNAGFRLPDLQKIINSPDNELAQKMFKAVSDDLYWDDYFKLTKVLELEVDHSYLIPISDYQNISDELKSSIVNPFPYQTDLFERVKDFNDLDLRRLQHKKYLVKFFKLRKFAGSRDLENFFKSQKAINMGSAGFDLVARKGDLACNQILHFYNGLEGCFDLNGQPHMFTVTRRAESGVVSITASELEMRFPREYLVLFCEE